MNAIDLLRKDHQEIERLFSEYEALDADDVDGREDLFQRIEKEILTHSDAEQQIFYRAVRSQNADLVERAESDHEEIKEVLAEMLEFEVDDEEFDSRMIQLMEKVRTHVGEEEGPGGILEIAGNTLNNERLSELAGEMQERKQNIDDELAA